MSTRPFAALLVVMSSVLAFSAEPAAPPAPPDPELDRIAEWMTGDFDTFAQVAADEAGNRAYKHLRALMHIVPATIEGLTAPDARTFYVEQAAAGAEDKPYRQRVYVLARRDGVPVNRIYRIEQPERFAGGFAKRELLAGLALDQLKLEEGCDLAWTRVDDALYTGIAGLNDTCKSNWRGGSHAVSQVHLTPTSITSLDQGFDDEGAHKWGPKPGTLGHVFEKRGGPAAALAESFAKLRAGGDGDVVWYVEGTLYRLTETGSYEALHGLVGYNVARLERDADSGALRIISREVFAFTDLKRKTLTDDRPPLVNEIELGVGVRAGRALAGLSFVSNGKVMTDAVPPVEIERVVTDGGEKLFTRPFVDVASGARRYWASEQYEFTWDGADASKARLVWQRDSDVAGLGRVHYVASGRRVASVEAISAVSPAGKALLAFVRARHPEYTAAPRRRE